jgi:two-component system, LuxR family, response regulator FixJ
MMAQLDTIPTVLIVDDDPAVRTSLKFSLEVEGFAVRLYANGQELLDAPDLPICACLVIDQRMPDMAGLEVVLRLRERNVTLPAILITTHPSPAMRSRAAGAGVAVVEKPLLTDALLHQIHHALAQR